MKTFYFVPLLLFFPVSPLLASHDTNIKADSIDLHLNKYDVHIKISQNEKFELASIIIEFGKERFVVPKVELEGIGTDFDLASTRLFVRASSTGAIKFEDLKELKISIPYGRSTFNNLGEYTLQSRDEVKFIFSKGRLLNRIRSVTMGDSKPLFWKVYSKEVGEKEEEEEGMRKGIKNPLGREIIENE